MLYVSSRGKPMNVKSDVWQHGNTGKQVNISVIKANWQTPLLKHHSKSFIQKHDHVPHVSSNDMIIQMHVLIVKAGTWQFYSLSNLSPCLFHSRKQANRPRNLSVMYERFGENKKWVQFLGVNENLVNSLATKPVKQHFDVAEFWSRPKWLRYNK